MSYLEHSFRRAAAARQKIAAARPADDAVLGGAVMLELDALEHVLSYLPPKDMAAAERVNRHFQQAVRRAAPARAAALGFELAERETLTLELLSRMEREKREAPGLLQHADISSLTRLWSFHFSVLRPLLDDEKLLTLLKEVANNKPTKRAFAAWRVVVRAKPAPSWAARNKSIIEAGLQATGTFASVAAVITKMPASIAEEHVDSLGAALSVLLAGLAGSYDLLVCAGASSGAACKDAPSGPRANPCWARRLPPRLRGEGRRPLCHRRETGARARQQGRLCGPALGRPRGGLVG